MALALPLVGGKEEKKFPSESHLVHMLHHRQLSSGSPRLPLATTNIITQPCDIFVVGNR